jgi:hypothetical protein
MLRILCSATAVIVLGCSADAPGSSNVVSFSLKQQLPAGTEAHLCELVEVPAGPDGEVFVNGRTHEYNGGSHHYGLYRTTLDKLPSDLAFNQIEDCWGPHNIMQYATDFIILEQSAKVTVDFPEGVALPFKSGEILLLQLHALNPQDQPADATVNVTLKTIDKSEVKQQMALLQFYDPYIYLAPHARSEANLRCEIPEDLTMIEANAHFHVRGVEHQSFLDPPVGPRATEPFLDNTDWEHPVQWHGTMPLAAGSHIRFHCQYQNPDNRVYTQGQDKYESEMCSFWGYVYPAPQDRTAMDCIGSHVSEYGVGTQSCADTTACIRACPASDAPDLSVPGIFNVGACYQKCIVDSCPAAGALIDQQEQCVRASCQAECPGAGCDSCVAAHCATQAAACQAATACR